jgi:glutamate racemase
MSGKRAKPTPSPIRGEDPSPDFFLGMVNSTELPAFSSREGHKLGPCDRRAKFRPLAKRMARRHLFASLQLSAVAALVPVLALAAAVFVSGGPVRPELGRFFGKESVTVAVTDSGLGGLAVMAEAVRRMKDAGVFRKADFVFFNTLFSLEGGYNSLKTRREKIDVLNSALQSLGKTFHPDLILIGCNTLSALYKSTSFSRTTKIPVIGIIETGVALISGGLRDHPDAVVILFGTPTTIAEQAHEKALARLGFSASRIAVQACPELETYIEEDCGGAETEMLIAACLDEALAKIAPPRPPLLVSLNCTHYGYSLPLWEKAFREAGVKPLAVLDPNAGLADSLISSEYEHRFPKTEVSARVVSLVEISGQKIQSLGRWLERVSPETAVALQRYEHSPSLFEWKRFVAPQRR